jgi:hypothetical protein
MAYFINPSHQSVSVYVYLPTVARQRLSKKRYRGKEHKINNRRIAGRVVLYAARIVIKKSR